MTNEERPLKSIYLGDGADYVGGKLLHNLLLFGRVCKALEMDVTPNRMMEVTHALEYVHLGHKQDVYHTMRALIVTHKRDIERFDEAFDLFWRRPAEGWTTLNLQSLGEERLQRKTQFLPPLESDQSDNNNAAEVDPSLIAIVPTFSQQETLRHKDFAEMSGEELDQAQKFMAKLPTSLGLRKTRRFKSGNGRQIDLRKTIRQNTRNIGEIIVLPTRTRKLKPRPVILICDISGSMERYTRVLLHFMHTLSSSMFQVESFVFSTKLTRITHPIRQKSVDIALRDIGLLVKEWGGGTKTGEALRIFNYFWSRRVLGRGAVVMLITDGWDRGDTETLRKEVARLRRSCHRLIWLNPLLGAPEYEPLTRGAQVMLPFVDDFLPVHNLASLEMIVNELQKLNWRRSAKKSHDHFVLAVE
jgi:uncharacterized protein with von Willebrand factor type A (vWA) domain